MTVIEQRWTTDTFLIRKYGRGKALKTRSWGTSLTARFCAANTLVRIYRKVVFGLTAVTDSSCTTGLTIFDRGNTCFALFCWLFKIWPLFALFALELILIECTFSTQRISLCISAKFRNHTRNTLTFLQQISTKTVGAVSIWTTFAIVKINGAYRTCMISIDESMRLAFWTFISGLTR